MSRRHLSLIFGLDNDNLTQAGSFIRFYLISHVFNHTFEFNLTSSFCDNDSIKRIPLSNQFALLDNITVRSIQFRTVRHVMSWQDNSCIHINKADFGQTTDYHLHWFTHFINRIYRTQFFEFQTCIILGYNTCIGSHIACDTTGMECTQCQLCTRFTDRLRSDYTNSFTFLNHTAGCQVTSVTLSTYTFLRFTSQYRTDFNAFNRRILDFLRNILCNFLTASHNQFSSSRMDDIMYRNTSQNTFVQSGNNFIVIFQSCTNQTTKCSTVFFINNHIMRHVHKTTSQISRIGRFQRGIRQTFTSTVGRDKIL